MDHTYIATVATGINIFSIIPQFHFISKNGVDKPLPKVYTYIGIFTSILWIIFAIQAGDKLRICAAMLGFALQAYILSKVVQRDLHIHVVKSST